MSQSLKQVLEELTGAYYEEAPKDTAYPYAVFSMRRISEADSLTALKSMYGTSTHIIPVRKT